MYSEASYQKAGYYPEYLQNLRGDLENASGLNMQWATDRLCTFSVRRINFGKTEMRSPPGDWKQILSVYHNLIVRGSPTYPTVQVERFLLDTISETVPITESDNNQSILYRDRLSGILREAWITVLARAHAALDSKLATPPEELGSPEEREFLNALSQKLGPSVYQLIECQRPFSTMVHEEEARRFYDQRVDFTIETANTRIILEIDGKQHQEPTQRALDQKRDQFLKANNWEVVRIPASDVRQNQIDAIMQLINERFRKDRCLIVATKNYAQPLGAHDAGRAALRLVMTPFALARIQWSIIWALINGHLDIQKRTLKIAVVEWDLPCAFLAVWDLAASLRHLSEMAGVKKEFPRIQLEIFRQLDWGIGDGIGALDDPNITVRVSKANGLERLRKEQFDLIISESTLRVGSRDLRGLVGRNPCIAVDSVHSSRGSDPQIESAHPIQYRFDQRLVEPPEGLVYFLHWIFRKRKFRDGQFEMLRRSLALEDLIGLLPTSGGKSLCYQLSSLLQPGTTLVVDPIISLMLDQTDNLKQLQIDAIGLVSSDQNREEQSTPAIGAKKSPLVLSLT